MKKLVSLLIALIMVMSMTIMSYGIALPGMDLKGASATMTNSEGEDCYDYFLFMTGDGEAVTTVQTNLDTLRYYLAVNTSYHDGTIMGYYYTAVTYDHLSTPGTITYKITPQIKGFDENTEFLVCAYGQNDAWSSLTSSYVDGEVVFDYESNAIDRFALVVRENTLDPDGVEPTKEGDEVYVELKDGIDANGNPVELPLMFVRTNGTDSGIDDFFNPIFNDNAYFTLISGSNDITLGDLQLLEKLEILVMDQEELAFPIELTISNSLINENTVLYPVHNRRLGQDGPALEILDYTPGDGEVTLVFNAFSPTALYADATTLNGYVAPTPLSPVTGDSDMGYVLLIGIIALAGMGIVAKKSN